MAAVQWSGQPCIWAQTHSWQLQSLHCIADLEVQLHLVFTAALNALSDLFWKAQQQKWHLLADDSIARIGRE